MKPAKVSFYSLRREIDELSLDPVAKLGLRLAFLSIGFQLIILALVWHRLPPETPLLYSRAYGQAQLVNSWWLWVLPVIALVTELISIRLAAKTGVENRLWSQLLSWIGAISAIMSLTTLARIILLVI
ncbi:MAG: hypothetical protein UY17_C0042G0002 [Candidatus Beckwithbacteria bacterium GW2011_GWC2_47_9]|uniref:DUF1648 domain-containing protein n=2 Tax=Candidatus Beckwithiibacteriota TaxID=1752726 RepID=A0A0G1W8F3_9BACT|nr:MAG: hypothetical protein UY17_C0042G0002 [Candidatus Beckwithbacteria bacterium GW2011_GWC2_47_9]OGD60742.1 MAG: hypothetical protein A3I57_00400 [Candidatus Beckwithbacteria bacterium RIFCSPLOWO2_02_FULL_47_23]